MRYTIGYDLMTPGKDYQQLYDALDRLGARRMMLSERIVRLQNTTAIAIRDYLLQYIDANDRLMVTCLDRAEDWAGWNLMTDPNALKNAA